MFSVVVPGSPLNSNTTDVSVSPLAAALTKKLEVSSTGFTITTGSFVRRIAVRPPLAPRAFVPALTAAMLDDPPARSRGDWL
jgi:hypothetical protein